MGDINARRGQIVGTDIRNGTATIECNVPLSTMFGYATDLRSKDSGQSYLQHGAQPLRYACPRICRKPSLNHARVSTTMFDKSII